MVKSNIIAEMPPPPLNDLSLQSIHIYTWTNPIQKIAPDSLALDIRLELVPILKHLVPDTVINQLPRPRHDGSTVVETGRHASEPPKLFPHVNDVIQSLRVDGEVPPGARRLARERVRRGGILGLGQGLGDVQLLGDGAGRARRVLGVSEEEIGGVEGAEEAGEGEALCAVAQGRLGHGDGGGRERLDEVGDAGEDVGSAGVGQGGAEGGEGVGQDGGVDRGAGWKDAGDEVAVAYVGGSDGLERGLVGVVGDGR